MSLPSSEWSYNNVQLERLAKHASAEEAVRVLAAMLIPCGNFGFPRTLEQKLAETFLQKLYDRHQKSLKCQCAWTAVCSDCGKPK